VSTLTVSVFCNVQAEFPLPGVSSEGICHCTVALPLGLPGNSYPVFEYFHPPLPPPPSLLKKHKSPPSAAHNGHLAKRPCTFSFTE